MVKAWGKELQVHLEARAVAFQSIPSNLIAEESVSLVLTLTHLPCSITMLSTLQAMFHVSPTVEYLTSLIESQYQLNSK